MTYVILGTSIFLQFIAAALAFRLMRVTRQSRAWGLIAIAITLMAVRRSVTGYHVFIASPTFTVDMPTEYISLTITILMVIGLAFIAPFFSTLQRSQQVIHKSEQAEQKLHEQETRVRLLLNSTAEAIYVLDMQGRCTFLNSACLKILGYQNVDQVLGRNMHDLIHHTYPDHDIYDLILRVCAVDRYLSCSSTHNYYSILFYRLFVTADTGTHYTSQNPLVEYILVFIEVLC